MKKIKILGIGQGQLIPSYRYRLEETIKEFKKYNIDFNLFVPKISSYPPKSMLSKIWWLISAILTRLEILKLQKNFDIIILQREMLSTLYTLERFMKVPFIFDVDDAIHLNQRFNSIENIARNASAIVVCNDFLANYYQQFNDNVHIIPTPVNIDKYKPKKNINQNKIIIGWIGTSSNFKSLKLIENSLNKIMNEDSNILLKIVSDKNPNFTKIPKNKYIYKKWLETEDVIDIQSFDIGIMPLVDKKQSYGKCAFKMLQYMACSIPVVTSCLPMNKKILETTKCGYCAYDYDEDWEKYLSKLCNDKGLRDRLGNNGRQLIEKNYSTKVYAELYYKIIENIYKG